MGCSRSKSPEVEEEDYFDMLEYSVSRWWVHAQEVENANMPQDDLAALTSEPTDGVLPSWFAIYDILDSDWLLNYWEPGNATVLHFASRYNLISFVDAILTQDVWADQRDRESQTPLAIAAGEGHKVLAELLVNRDDVDANSKDIWGNTPLSLAATWGQKDVVDMLLNRNDVDVDSKNLDGNTPLSLAAEAGYKAVVETLLNQDDVDVNSKNDQGMTPLSFAAAEGREAVVKILVNRHEVNIDSKNREGDTALSLAAQNHHKAILEILLQWVVDSDSGKSQLTVALLRASERGSYEIVKLLLQQNADANARGDEQRTLLCWVAFHSHYGYSHYGYSHYELAKLLLPRASNADQEDIDGRTPLSYAADSGYEALVKLFVERSDVDADSKDADGRTPLSYAAGNGHVGILPLFVERHDVDVNSKDKRGRSPLSWALKLFDYEVLPCEMYERSVRAVDLLINRHDISLNGEDKNALAKYYDRKKVIGNT